MKTLHDNSRKNSRVQAQLYNATIINTPPPLPHLEISFFIFIFPTKAVLSQSQLNRYHTHYTYIYWFAFVRWPRYHTNHFTCLRDENIFHTQIHEIWNFPTHILLYRHVWTFCLIHNYKFLTWICTYSGTAYIIHICGIENTGRKKMLNLICTYVNSFSC